MSDEQFMKLFKYMEEFRAEVNTRMDEFERLLDWARKVSEKTGIPLENL